MGVIKKSEPKLGIFTSSEESLHIHESSDDDHAVSSQEVSPSPANHFQHRLQHRVPSLPINFCKLRNYLGRKRLHHYENVDQLLTLVENEELGEVTIHDFIQNTNNTFQRLLDDETSLEAWHSFIQSSEEVQMQIIGQRRSYNPSAKSSAMLHFTKPTTGEEAFKNIKTGLRSVLKRRDIPLGLLEFLENQLVEFFLKMPDGTFISSSLSSYERLLLHAISQYHNLISNSFDSEQDNMRLVKVFNPYKEYQIPTVLLVKFLEDRRNTGDDIH